MPDDPRHPIRLVRAAWHDLEPPPAGTECDLRTKRVVEWLQAAWTVVPIPAATPAVRSSWTLRLASLAAAALLLAAWISITFNPCPEEPVAPTSQENAISRRLADPRPRDVDAVAFPPRWIVSATLMRQRLLSSLRPEPPDRTFSDAHQSLLQQALEQNRARHWSEAATSALLILAAGDSRVAHRFEAAVQLVHAYHGLGRTDEADVLTSELVALRH